MSIIGYKRLVILLIGLTVVLAGFICYLGFERSFEQLEIKAIWNVIADFERTRKLLGKMEINDCAAFLDITAHLNSNAKNRQLKLILEQEKALMINDIIQELRRKTGDDLGSDPEKWIDKYSGSQVQILGQ